MTKIDDIIKHIEETPGWYLTPLGRLRRAKQGLAYCPIESLANMSSYIIASRKLTLDLDIRDRLMTAADNPAYYEPWLRTRLLQAAKLP